MDAYFASPEAQICRSVSEAGNDPALRIVHIPLGTDPVLEFARSALRGLSSSPRSLESRFLYDSAGSALFERITVQPEYYLTRTESAILTAHAQSVREITGPVNIVELGSGSSRKTDHLLRAWLARPGTFRYLPVDVSGTALLAACNHLRNRYPALRVTGLNCDYREAFPVLAQLSPVMVTFLGSSIGNFTKEEMVSFVTSLAAALRPGDFLLLGVDLVKRRSLLEAAYNDEAGVTAQFTRNVFARMNRELRCDVDLDAIEHCARYSVEDEQIEIDAHFTREQALRLVPGSEIVIPSGDRVRTEICRKFRLEQVIPELARCGFRTEEVFGDDRRWFALLLLRRLPSYSLDGAGRRP